MLTGILNLVSLIAYFNNNDYKLSFGGSPITKTSISDKNVDIIVDFPMLLIFRIMILLLMIIILLLIQSLSELYSMSSEMIDNLNTGYF